MVTLTTEGNSLKFTFQDSQHYLQGNGEIIAPKGSLALITDDTDMCNFVKADSNDIFVSVTYDELGMSKSEILTWFAANAGSSGGGGEGGLTPEEAQEMIDESISGKADTSAVTQALTEKVDVDTYDSYTATTDAAIASKADESDLSALESVVGTKASEADLQALESVVGGKLATSDFNTYSAATDSVIASKASNTDLQSVSAATDEKLAINDFNTYSSATQTTLNGKANASDLQALESVVDTKANASDLDALTSVVNGKADTTAMTQELASKLNISDFNTYSASVDTAIASKADTTAMTQALSTKQDTLVSGTNIKTINNTSILGSGNIEIQVEVDDELDIDSPNAVANSAITKAIQDNELVTANALIALQDDLDDKASQTDLQSVSAATASNTTALGGLKLVKLTQTEYDNLSVKDSSTIYFIVN